MRLQLREHGQPGLCHTRHTSCAADPTTQQALIADCSKDLESKARLALHLVETELHDIMRSERGKEPRGGRAVGPVFKWKPALGRVGSHQLRISPVSVAWGVVASASQLSRTVSKIAEAARKYDARQSTRRLVELAA